VNPLTKIFRVFHINYVLARHGIDRIVFSTQWFAALRFLAYLNPWNWISTHQRPRGMRIRQALEDLGPIFVKFGQMLSTRRDLLPEDIANELALLQDRVLPFPGSIARNIIESVYGMPPESVFSSFNEVPLASASIAQVHLAKLQDGQEVVVKILRPNIRKVIERDLSLLYSVASIAERFWSDTRRLRPRDVVAEFERCLLDELDLVREAASASQLRRNFLDSPLLYVPTIYWHYARKQVIVMERIHGIPVSNIAELKQRAVNLKVLAERGVEIFFTQVFRDCFFHADMHPGNIFVDASKPEEPRYIAVDFGIIGSLNPNDQRYLAENFLAFFKRDYRRVAQLHVESGWVPYDTRIDEFESAIRTVCEPVFEKPLRDISCGQVLLHLFQTARRFHMEVQPQLVLLQKTLLNIEGLGRDLYPELDLWNTAKPFLEKWIRKQVGVRASFKKIRDHVPFVIEKLVEMPDLIHNALTYVKVVQHKEDLQRVHLKRLAEAARRAKRRGFLFGLGGAFVIFVLLNVGVNENMLGKYLSWPTLMWSFGISGFFVLFYAYFLRSK
jgi:ubiquinone biosynthesis protein